MTTSVRTRTKPSRAIVSAAPEVAPGEGEPVPGEPVDAGERCGLCRGHGMVRGVGKNAGKPYRTTAGAQAAMEAGRARDCEPCGATGLIESAPF